MLELLGTLLSTTDLAALFTTKISFLCFFCGTSTSCPAGSSAALFIGAILT